MISSTNSTNSNQSFASEEEETELLPLLFLLWSRKLFIGCLILVGCIVGILVSLNKTSVYRADALIQLETKNSGITLSDNISDMMSSESEAVTEIEIIKSRMVIGKAVQEMKLDIVSEPRSFPLLKNIVSVTGWDIPDWQWLATYGIRGEKIQIESLNVSDKFLGKPFVVTSLAGEKFQIEAPDGSVIEGLVGEATVNLSKEYQIHVSSITARPGVEFLVRKDPEIVALNRLRQSLGVTEKGRKSNLLVITMENSDIHQARKTLDQILRAYVAQNIGRSSEEAEKSLEFLRKQLPVVQNDLSLAEDELNEFRLKNESINMDLESASVLERMVDLDTKISEISLQEAELSRLYTKAHPRYTALLSQRDKLISEKKSLSAMVQSFPETQQEIVKRTRNLEVNQQIFLQLLNKRQELNVLKASNVGSVRIIDGAISNPAPVSPGRMMVVLMYALLAMLAGCGVVLVRSFLERNVDTPEDISKLGLPVYATIPRSVSQEGRAGRAYMLARDDPSELAVEAIRSLRTSLHFGMLESGKGVISITGPAPEIGKSFVAANLAYLAAESGSKVLLIDADMRRGTVARIFGVEKNEAGLSELLAGSIKLEQIIKPIALTHGVSETSESLTHMRARTLEPELEAVLGGIDLLEPEPRNNDGLQSAGPTGQLSVMPRGKAPPNPSELLMQDRLPNLLREASQSYDLVIVDTPPVLAVTDAMIIGKYADMNLMVVRHNQTGVHEVEEVAKVFSVNSVELSGVILNGYDQKNGRFGQHGYAYGYQYQYQSTD